MKTWVKLYTEVCTDPDIGELTLAQKGVWMMLLALAGQIDARDENDQETGELDTIGRVAWGIRCTTAELADALAAFADKGMVEERDGILWLPNYGKRQRRAPTDRHTAVAERVKRHRERKATASNEVVTTLQPACNEDVTSLESESDTESYTDTEIGAIAPVATPPPAAPEPEKVKRVDMRSDPRSKHPAIQCIRGLNKNHYPPIEIYDEAISVLGDKPNGPRLSDCRKEWVKRGHNPAGWGWLDWYRDGIPSRGNGHGPPRASPQANDAWANADVAAIIESNAIKERHV
ncbi:MAG: hypothetical protein WC565_06425 [Parcubacteria group bacterium]|jgi:hypothetical protein